MLNLDYVNPSSRQKFTQAYSLEELKKIKLSVAEYENAVLLPNSNMNGGVYANGEFVYNTSLHRGWVKKFAENTDTGNYVDEEVVYVGMLAPIWGHCITDDLKHFWFLLDRKYASLKKKKFVYMNIFPGQSLPDNFLKMIANIGVKPEQFVCVNEATKFARVYIPDECWFFDESQGYCYTKEYLALLEKSFSKVEPSKEYESVYFTRTGIKGHKDVNEISVEKYFEKHGYKVIHPQNITFEQQAAILKGCRNFAATEGSISHNVIFCTKDTNVIILRKDNNSINGYQTALNKIAGSNIIFIDANHTVLLNKTHPWDGPFFLYVTKYLASFFNEKKPVCIRDFFVYVFEYLPRQIYKRMRGF